MFKSDRWVSSTLNRLSRRQWFGWVGVIGGGALAAGRVGSAATAVAEAPQPMAGPGSLAIGPNIYQSIGVRPFINGTGTLTVNSGSLELPEVQEAQTWKIPWPASPTSPA